MPSRKRVTAPTDDESNDEPPSLLHRIRNMWQFANLCQWIYIFGKAAKIDDSIDIEELETDCLKPQSMLLSEIALALLKLVSLHRGLTADILDDQLRKHYLAKAPKQNPFGDETEPVSFSSLDVFAKIKVLQMLTQWTMIHPDRVRERMSEQKDVEQTNWRIEPYGWDRHDRVYYVLDDNRIYRFTEPELITPQPQPKRIKHYRTGRRASKRQRIASSSEDGDDEASDSRQQPSQLPENGLGGGTWECVAITLQETQAFTETLAKTRDGNEKILRKQLETHLLPILEKQEEAMKRKELQRERELLNLAKMANAKRSSRIADKAEKQKKEVEEMVEQRQRQDAEKAEHQERLAQLKLEQERDMRMFARQRRLKEREARRIRHEEELAQLSEDSKNGPEAARISERRLHAEIQRNQQALKDIEQEEDDWVFDCICGLYGQVDDGTHSVACEKCNIWQHSKCLGISEDEAEQSEFHFVCSSCRHREDEKNKSPRTIIKIKVRPSSVATGPATRPEGDTPMENMAQSSIKSHKDRSANEFTSIIPKNEPQRTSQHTVYNEAPQQAVVKPQSETLGQQSTGRSEPDGCHRLSSISDITEPAPKMSNQESILRSDATVVSENRPLGTPTMSTEQGTVRDVLIEGSARSGPSSVETKAQLNTDKKFITMPLPKYSDSESSSLLSKQARHSALSQQSPTGLALTPSTKDDSVTHKGAVETPMQPAPYSLLQSIVPEPPVAQVLASTTLRPTDHHESGQVQQK